MEPIGWPCLSKIGAPTQRNPFSTCSSSTAKPLRRTWSSSRNSAVVQPFFREFGGFVFELRTRVSTRSRGRKARILLPKADSGIERNTPGIGCIRTDRRPSSMSLYTSLSSSNNARLTVCSNSASRVIMTGRASRLISSATLLWPRSFKRWEIRYVSRAPSNTTYPKVSNVRKMRNTVGLGSLTAATTSLNRAPSLAVRCSTSRIWKALRNTFTGFWSVSLFIAQHHDTARAKVSSESDTQRCRFSIKAPVCRADPWHSRWRQRQKKTKGSANPSPGDLRTKAKATTLIPGLQAQLWHSGPGRWLS